MCLAVVGDQLGNANLGQQVCSQTNNARLWHLNRTNQVPLHPDTLVSDTQNGTYELRNGAGFLCADNNKSTSAGAVLKQSLCKHENNQRWKVADKIPDTAEKIEFNLLVITKVASDLSGTEDWMSSKTATEQARQRQRKWSEVVLPGFFHDYSNGRIKLNVYYYESPHPLTQLAGHGAVSPVQIPEDLDIIVNPGWFDGIYINHSTSLQNGINGLITYGWSDGHFTTGVSNSPIDDTTPLFMSNDIAQVGALVHEFTHQLEYYFQKNPGRQQPTAACNISSPGASLLDCGSNELEMGGYGINGPTDGLGNHLAFYRDYLNGYIKNGTLGLGDTMWSMGNILREINTPAAPGGPLAPFANKSTCLNLTTPSGLIAKNLSGNNNFARVNNSNKSLNWTGTGFLFDGLDDYLRIGNLVGDDFTTSFWIKSSQAFPAVGSSEGIGLVYAGADSDGFELRGLRNASGNDVVSFKAGNNPAIIGSVDVTTNAWVHIAVVRNKTTGIATLYINGKLAASGNAGVQRLNKNPIVKIGSAFQFKKIGASALINDHFSGEMADFCLQNAALDAVAVAQSAQSRNNFDLPQGQQTLFLSDMPMFSGTSGFGPIGLDTGISGGSIAIQGHVYSKGVAAHAPSKIVYKLDGTALRFISDVGIDDDVPDGQGIASADFQVYGDGILLYQSKIQGDNDAPETIDVDIRGVKELMLIIAAGNNNDATADHADWANARLLK